MLEHLHDGEIFELFWKYGLASSNVAVKGFAIVLVLVAIGSILFTIRQIHKAHTEGGMYKVGSLAMQAFWLVTLGFLIVYSMPQQFVQIFHML